MRSLMDFLEDDDDTGNVILLDHYDEWNEY